MRFTQYFVEVEYEVREEGATIDRRDDTLVRLAREQGGEWTGSDFGPFSAASARAHTLLRGNGFDFRFGQIRKKRVAANVVRFIRSLPSWSMVTIIGSSDARHDNLYHIMFNGKKREIRDEEDEALFAAAKAQAPAACVIC